MHFVHTLFTCTYAMLKTSVLMSIYDKYRHAGIHVVLNRDMLAFVLCINIDMLDLIILTQITPHISS